MSKTIKKVIGFAAPIVGNMIAPGIGGVIGGALGGAISGGGLKGAVLGGVTGGLSGAGGASSILGKVAGAPLSGGLSGPTMGSGVLGAVTGGGMRALSQGITGALGNRNMLMGLGNQLMAQEGADTAEEVAREQARGLQRGIVSNINANKPYTQLGANAAKQIGEIQADPTGYVQNNTFYKSLADDASRRLMANQAAKGKVGSGGTAAALQEQLLTLGNGLVQQQLGTLQNQVNTGSAAAAGVGANTANMQAAQGDVLGAGKQGAYNAINSGYQNQINTLLALQGTQRAPIYV